jgi:hypothetical protein
MSTSIDVEGGVFCCGMNMVVIGELCHREPFIPIILLFVHEYMKILFELLVNPFGLPIQLGVICGRRCDLNAKQSIEFAHEGCNKLRSKIGKDREGKAMKLPDVLEVQSCRA